MTPHRPALLVLVGPTASGKTALGVALAERLGGEIVSADSQQCYRGLDAGTAKPSAEERARAPHHLLDVAEPEHQLDVAQYVALADAAIKDVTARARRPIVVGGTGLWIRALLRGLLDAPGADPEFRARFRHEAQEAGVPAMHARLARVDPDAAKAILPNDRVRIERALEVFELGGTRLSTLQRQHRFAVARYEAKFLYLDPPRDLLWSRIEQRTRAMFAGPDAPLLRETRWLLERIERIPDAAKALKIIGYGEAADAIRAGGDADAIARAEQRTLARTRQYAKRQRTWFNRDAGEPLPWPPDALRLSDEAERWYDAAPRPEGST